MSDRVGWSSAALAFLRCRGITPEVAAQVGVREVDDILVFPFVAPDGSTFDRRRSLKGSGPAKVLQPNGEPLTAWWPEGRPVEPPAAVLACEGETDALAAVSALRSAPSVPVEGLAVLAVPGTGYPVKRLADELEAVGSPPAYLAFDADDAGCAYTAKVAALGSVRAIPVELPEGSDLAELLAGVDDPGDTLATLIADSQAVVEEALPPGVTYDPATGQPVGALERLNRLNNDVEFTAQWRQIGSVRATYFGTVRNQRTGRPQEIGPLTRKQLRQMSYLADEIWEADGGELQVRRRGSEHYQEFYRALKAATRIEEHHVTEESIWRPRVAKYLADRVTQGVDPNDKGGRLRILLELRGEPFEDPQGRVNVNVENLAEFLRPQRLDLTVPQIAAALKHHIGFESITVQQRLPETDRNRKLNYWRAPADFDWRSR
jgi:Toprim-like